MTGVGAASTLDCTSARREITARQQGTVEKGVIELPDAGTSIEAETASANLLDKLLIECAFSIHADLCPIKGPSSIFGFPRTEADFTSPL